jgi:CTP synthase (UTP-ammonia lyase)
VGLDDRVTFVPGSRVAALYGESSSVEPFMCSYGLEPAWEAPLAGAGLRVTGRGPAGEPRVVELDGHPFFCGTLFVPQCRSSADAPHPVVRGFVASLGV